MGGRIAEIATAVRSGEISATDLVAAAIDRAERSQPVLNAFTSIDGDGALERAAAIDHRIGAGEDPGSLTGVPIGLKDLIDQQGLPTTNGAAFTPTVPDRSAEVVRRLEAAGAAIIGRTGLHEFAYGFTSENEHFGPVRNPWDTDLSPGGSSGGSAAAVAAGIVPAAIGTDTGGSVRVPAALCGVVGLKVTHGRVSLAGVTPLAPSLDTVGPLAGTVADLAAVYGAIAGDDPGDPWSAPMPVLMPRHPADPATVRVGVPVQWNSAVIDSSTKAAFDEMLDLMAAAGATVEPVDEPSLAITEAAAGAASLEILLQHRERWSTQPERYGSEIADRLRGAEAVPDRYCVDVLAWDAGARHALGRLFTQFDVLATPTVGATRKVIGDPDIDIDGEAIFHRTVLSPYTWPVNRTGNPALALPITGSGAPPASMQLIGPRFGEAALLEVGLGLEDSGLIKVEQPPIFFG
ncbi:MAG: AtzE family amidohydrolase [Acidimicrobiia bacterium]|nr:MAG: AtzE family amidohydrolase [Acidimicrobiia bacterium]